MGFAKVFTDFFLPVVVLGIGILGFIFAREIAALNVTTDFETQQAFSSDKEVTIQQRKNKEKTIGRVAILARVVATMFVLGGFFILFLILKHRH